MQTISILWEDGAASDWDVPYRVSMSTVLREIDFHAPGMGVPRAVSVGPWRED